MDEFDDGVPTQPGRNGGRLRVGGGRGIDPRVRRTREVIQAGLVEVAESLVKRAVKGDVRAAGLILAYGLGKPTERVELSGPDGGPMQLLGGLTDHETQALAAVIDAEVARKVGEPA